MGVSMARETHGWCVGGRYQREVSDRGGIAAKTTYRTILNRCTGVHMQYPSLAKRSRITGRLLAAGLALALLAAAGARFTGAALGSDAERALAPTGPAAQSPTLQPFEATGLPAGAARGVPARLSLPAGFTLKHVHGGPTYIYVISGVLEIQDSDGASISYHAGDFFWEPPGYINTVTTPEAAEVFTLQFLTPGAEATIPVR